jgi:polyhydroxyalkanoate synthesis repressor PhaR
MPTIKRYPNRKLYDTEAKQYITLKGIADLIRQGQDVRVVDYASGEDLTTLTLAQIMFDQEKKVGGFVPHPVLSGLIHAGGKTLSALQHSLASPLEWLGQVDAEIARRVDTLVGEGELTQEEGERLKRKLSSPRAQPAPEKPLPSEQEIEQMLEKRGIPTRADLQLLDREVEALAARLDQIGSGEPPLPSPPKRTQRKRR